MTLLKFAEEAATRRNAPVTTTRRGTAVADLPKAELWINIGVEVNGRFVNLPNGLPLDTMIEAPIRGNNQEWNAFQTSRNKLFEEVMAAASKLKPGEEMELPLFVRVRRVADPAAVADVDNAFMGDFATMMSGARVIAPPAPAESEQQ